jgi:ferredoxin
MSLESFSTRLPQNSPGKFYVDEQCLDCDLCRVIAPSLFAYDISEGVSFITKQPETQEELYLVKECLEGCPCEAIHDDGDEFDWSEPRNPRPSFRGGSEPKPKCRHCQNTEKPWWKFWA